MSECAQSHKRKTEPPKLAYSRGCWRSLAAVSALTQRKPEDRGGQSGVDEALTLGPVRGRFESQVRHGLVWWPPLSACLPTVMIVSLQLVLASYQSSGHWDWIECKVTVSGNLLQREMMEVLCPISLSFLQPPQNENKETWPTHSRSNSVIR